jgi:type III pantothenate kinase
MHSQAWHLYVDIGNTRVKWALAYPNSAPGDWYRYGVYPHQSHGSFAFLEELSHQRIETIWCANVAGNQVQALFDAALSQFAWRPARYYVTPAQDYLHLHNSYAEPQQLGADRWLAALAASYLYAKQDLLIVSMGTATTIDVVDAQAHFLGGWILPGLTTMLTSLGQATAQLPLWQDLADTDTPSGGASGCPQPLQPEPNIFDRKQIIGSLHIGRDTLHAIYQGCLASQIGAIQHCFKLSGRAIGAVPTCILTGGAREAIIGQLDFPVIEIPDLVLQGLQVYAAGQQALS